MKTTTLSALAEPNRTDCRVLPQRLPLSGGINEGLGLRQPQASKHLRILRDAEIVEVHGVAYRRIYKLRHQVFQGLDVWLDRRVWDGKLDCLDDYLHELKEKR